MVSYQNGCVSCVIVSKRQIPNNPRWSGIVLLSSPQARVISSRLSSLSISEQDTTNGNIPAHIFGFRGRSVWSEERKKEKKIRSTDTRVELALLESRIRTRIGSARATSSRDLLTSFARSESRCCHWVLNHRQRKVCCCYYYCDKIYIYMYRKKSLATWWSLSVMMWWYGLKEGSLFCGCDKSVSILLLFPL